MTYVALASTSRPLPQVVVQFGKAAISVERLAKASPDFYVAPNQSLLFVAEFSGIHLIPSPLACYLC
jgi:hypothetical protein